MTDFTTLPDLASRAVGGAAVAANDESFAERENLLRPGPPERHDDFGHKGKVYDGWETRRRRTPGTDWVIVRLGVPGLVHGVVVDTSFFTGNYPPRASVDGLAVEGYPTAEALAAAEWTPLLPAVQLRGDTRNAFPVECGQRFTHVRLTIDPDGGVARLRVHGTPVADPRLLDAGPVDLAALENGGLVAGCSNAFYSAPTRLISPGLARSMGEGWETARRRHAGNDWVTVRLATTGVVRLAELDTSWFLHNAPGAARLTGCVPDRSQPNDPATWPELLPRAPLLPDTRHRFVLAGGPAVTDVRLDVYPDGGMARLRLWGVPTAAGRSRLGRTWFDTLPAAQAVEVLVAAGVPAAEAVAAADGRPTLGAGPVPPAVAALLDGPGG
ncbi:MAG: allantoicase [Mycobacteriales bacterium]